MHRKLHGGLAQWPAGRALVGQSRPFVLGAAKQYPLQGYTLCLRGMPAGCQVVGAISESPARRGTRCSTEP